MTVGEGPYYLDILKTRGGGFNYMKNTKAFEGEA
jgi:hypothetical protein